MRFKLRAAVPEGADGGVLGVVLLGPKANGEFGTITQLVWNRRMKTGGYEEIEFELKGSSLGRTSGRYRIFFYKIGNSGALALSTLSWVAVR